MKKITFLLIFFLLAACVQAQEVPLLASKDGKYALKSADGKIISDWYSAVYDFSYGIATVRQMTAFGAIDQNGKVVIPVKEDTKSIRLQTENYLLKTQTHNAELFFFLANYFQGNDHKKEVEYYEKAYTFDGVNAENYLKLADKVNEFDNTASIPYYEKAFLLEGSTAENYLKLADKVNEFDNNASIPYYEKAFLLEGSIAENYLKLADKVYSFNEELSVPYYEKAYQSDSLNFENCFKIGKAIQSIDRKKSIFYYEKAYVLNPKNVMLCIQIGDISKSSDELKAINYYRKANALKRDTVKLTEKFDFISTDIAAIQNPEGKYGIIDTLGNLLTKDWYAKAWYGSESNMMIGLMNEKEEWQYFNHKGKFLDIKFKNISVFSEGIAFVRNFDDKWGAINEKGELIIEYQFDDLEKTFENGKAQVTKNGETFYINAKGERLKE